MLTAGAIHRSMSSVDITANKVVQPAKEKGKGIPYSITERRVPELIPVIGMAVSLQVT